MEKDLVRLQKFLAQCGIDSRRKCEELISAGKVSVNGEVVTELGTKINTKYDKVVYEGKELKSSQRHIYIMLNKPEGYITTSKEQFDRPYVLELLEGIDKRVYPVGRLDMDTSGLLLLTDDGEFAYMLTHPKHDIAKTYIAEVKGRPTSEEMTQFSKGIALEDYTTAPAHIRLMKERKNSCIMEVTIFEGKNRQIRKMFDAIGHTVISLQRIAVGELFLRNLEEGKYQILKKNEVNKVFINKYRKDNKNESARRTSKSSKRRTSHNSENKSEYKKDYKKEYKKDYNKDSSKSYGKSEYKKDYKREDNKNYGQRDSGRSRNSFSKTGRTNNQSSRTRRTYRKDD